MRETASLINFALKGLAAAVALMSAVSAATAGEGREPAPAGVGCTRGQPLRATIAACSEAIARDPGLADAYAIRGEAYRAMLKYDDALTDLSRAIELEPGSLFARSRRAALYDEQKSRQAKADLDFVLAAIPKTAGDYEARSYANKVDRRTSAALADIGEAIRLDPSDPLLYATRAAIHHARQEWRQAIDEAGNALAIAPNLSMALGIRADSYFSLAGNSGLQRDATALQNAVADATRAIDLAPDEPRLYYSRGRAYVLQLELFKAQRDYEKALELAPEFAEASEQLKKIKQETAPFATSQPQGATPAIERVQSAMAAAPRLQALAYFLNGTRQLAASNFKEAIAELDQALSVDPLFADAFTARALARLRLHEVVAAMVDLDKAIELSPRGERAYILRGDALAKRGEFTRAFADFDRALALNPKSVEARAARGLVYISRDDIASAGKEFDAALMIDPKNVTARLGRGEVDLRSGERRTAIAAYQEILAVDPTSMAAREGLERAKWSFQGTPTLSKGLPMRVSVVGAAQPGCGRNCPEWIYAEGTLDENTPFRFEDALAAIGNKKVPVFVSSPGGSGEAGYQVGRLIRKRGLDVVVARTEMLPCKENDEPCLDGRRVGIPVAADAHCESACVFLLAGGRRRFVAESAVVGVHRFASYRIYRRGQRVIKTERTTTPASSYAIATRFLQEMGIGQSIMPLLQSTSHEGVYWLSRDELRATKIMTDEKNGEELIAELTSPSWTVSEQRDAAIAARKAFAETAKSVH